jgi:hypothetical protein
MDVHFQRQGRTAYVFACKGLLRVAFPKDGDDLIMSVRGSVTGPQDGSFVETVHTRKLSNDAYQVAFALFVLESYPLPSFIHFDLYVTHVDKDSGFLVRTPLAAGVTPFRLLTQQPVDLFDVAFRPEDRHQQATLQLQFVSYLTSAGGPSIPESKMKELCGSVKPDPMRERALLGQKWTNEFVDQMLTAIHRSYDTLGVSEHDRWVTYNSHFGRLPILLFAYSCKRIRANTNSVQRTMSHMLKVATVSLGYDLQSMVLGPMDAVKYGNVLSEMCCQHFRGLIYCRDTTRTAYSDCKPTDLWSHLSAFPRDFASNESVSLGYDCEDGSMWVLEFLHLLRHSKFDKQEEGLCRMQQFVNQYAPCFTIGKLGQGEGRDPVDHAYVVLFDKRFLRRQKAAYWNTIVIESTTHSTGSWYAAACDDAEKRTQERDAFDAAQQLFYVSDPDGTTVFSNPMGMRKGVKLLAKVGVLLEKGMYGNVDMLCCPDLDGEVVQFAVNSPSSVGGQGAPAMDLFLHYSRVSLVDVTRIVSSQTVYLDDLLTEFPITQFPEPPSDVPGDYSLYAAKPASVRYYINPHVYEKQKSVFQRAFALYQRSKTCEPVTAVLNSHSTVVYVDA